MRDLDEANARLKATLDELRGTMVESKLRPDGEEGRHLLDFVDEGGVEGVYEAVRDLIDGAGVGIRNFDDYNRQFGDELEKVVSVLDGAKRGLETGLSIGEDSLGITTPILDLVHDMEDHARDVAVNGRRWRCCIQDCG